MTYRQDNEKRKKRNRLVLFLIAAVFIFFFQHKILSFFSGIATAKAEPAFKSSAFARETVSNVFFSAFSFKSSLMSENGRLKEELNEANAKLLDRERLLSENMELKAVMGRTERGKLLLSAILAKPNQSPYDTLLLDAGEENGVSAGDKVLAYGSVVIGEIRDVSKDTSRAVLFSSPGEEYEGIVSGSNISIKLSGKGGGNFTAELPRDMPLPPGTEVFSIGLSPYVLGTVESVLTDPRNPFQTIILKSPVNVSGLRLVQIAI